MAAPLAPWGDESDRWGLSSIFLLLRPLPSASLPRRQVGGRVKPVIPGQLSYRILGQTKIRDHIHYIDSLDRRDYMPGERRPLKEAL